MSVLRDAIAISPECGTGACQPEQPAFLCGVLNRHRRNGTVTIVPTYKEGLAFLFSPKTTPPSTFRRHPLLLFLPGKKDVSSKCVDTFLT